MLRTPAPGRPRALDSNKKRLVCDAVSRGATLAEAAVTIGVSLRTVQREARLDPRFDQQLRLAHNDKPDPLILMHSAARTHWRAAAWLLERTDPERYAKRPASAVSPQQFQAALNFILEAALEATPPEHRAAVYEHVEAACQEAIRCVLPNLGPWSRPINPQLPSTPLADRHGRERLADPKHRRVIAEDEFGRIEAAIPPARLPAPIARRVDALHPPYPHQANGDFLEERRSPMAPRATAELQPAPALTNGCITVEEQGDCSPQPGCRNEEPACVSAEALQRSLPHLPANGARVSPCILSPKMCITTEHEIPAADTPTFTHMENGSTTHAATLPTPMNPTGEPPVTEAA